MANLSLSNEELFRSVLMVLGFDRVMDDSVDDATEGDVRQAIRAGIRRFYNPVSAQTGTPYQWRFLERIQTFAGVAPFSEGLVTLSDGLLSLDDGEWPVWAADGLVRVGEHVLFAEAVEAPDALRVREAGLSIPEPTPFHVERYRFELADDFSHWMDGLTYQQGTKVRALAHVGESDLRLQYQMGVRNMRETSHFAMTFRPDGGQYIHFWPTPAAGANIQGVYLSVPGDRLPEDLRIPSEDPIIQVGPIYADALLQAILAAADAFNNDQAGIHEQKFQLALDAAIQHDSIRAGHQNYSHSRGREELTVVGPIDFRNVV